MGPQTSASLWDEGRHCGDAGSLDLLSITTGSGCERGDFSVAEELRPKMRLSFFGLPCFLFCGRFSDISIVVVVDPFELALLLVVFVVGAAM